MGLPRCSTGPQVHRLAVGHPHPAGHFGNTQASEGHKLATRRLDALTDRERDVANTVGAGGSKAEIATSLFMSEATVKAHVWRLLSKLEVSDRVQIAILVNEAAQS